MKQTKSIIVNKGWLIRSLIIASVISFVITAFTFRQADQANISGCDLSISANNGSTSDDIKMFDLSWKIKGGWWATVIPNPPVMHPGGSIHHTFHTLFNCSDNRRYRFKLERNGGTKTDFIYIPSETGWTTETTVNLGDVNGLVP